MEDITQEELKRLLHYNPKTGIFRWKKIAGKTTSRGYRVIKINKKRYYAHRLAFLYMTGEFPSLKGGKVVDHKNQKKDDNWWRNLRVVTSSTNSKNI